ncbi:MAG: DUF4271 domain-containing protein [Bacteroidales bacterium]
MLQQDTLYITDSASCRYIVTDIYISQKDTILPIDSLWSTKTLTHTVSLQPGQPGTLKNSDDILSALILAFFVLLVFFSREVINVLPAVLKSLFKLKNHFKLEDKLALSNQRDVVTIIAALYFPVLITLMSGDYLIGKYQILPLSYLLISLGFIFAYWLLRKTLYNILSWVTKDKITFKLVEKIGYNHLIISVIFSFPSILINFIWPGISDYIIINILVISLLFVYVFYIIRGYQIIIAHRYSHFFYILYLCAVELLPVALIVNFILSY